MITKANLKAGDEENMKNEKIVAMVFKYAVLISVLIRVTSLKQLLSE